MTTMRSLAVYGSIVAAERRSASAAERQAVERLALDTADTCPWNGTEVAADEAGEEMHLTDDDQPFCVRAGSAHIDTTCSSGSRPAPQDHEHRISTGCAGARLWFVSTCVRYGRTRSMCRSNRRRVGRSPSHGGKDIGFAWVIG